MCRTSIAAEIEITPEMTEAAFAVLDRYGVRDALEISSFIMGEMLLAAFNPQGKEQRTLEEEERRLRLARQTDPKEG
jgi:hypothetical protein